MREHIQQFPHCDQRILHAPGECEFCDAHPEWQELRESWGIAFTGHSYDKDGKLFVDEYGNVQQACPAEANRGMKSINSWGGNLAETTETKIAREKYFENLGRKLKEQFGVPWEEEELGYDPEELDKSVGTEPTFGRKVTSSGKPADPEYDGPAPQPINPATGQHKDYWVLAPEEIAKGFVRPVRQTYRHLKCGTTTSMSVDIAKTYARDPKFYGATFCVHCREHFPVGENGEFVWEDGSKVGT